MTNNQLDHSNGCAYNKNEKEICEQRKRDFILSETQKLSKTGHWEFDLKTQVTQWSDEMFNIHELHLEFDTNDYYAVLSLYEESSRQLFLDAGARLVQEKTPFDITARI